jgi:hypothetical protein
MNDTTARRASEETGPSGADLLDETRAYLARFVRFPSDAAADTAALWAAHTHATDHGRMLVFDSTPRLAVLGDVAGCGKTLLLTLLENLTARGILVSQPTAPSLVTLIRDEHATLIIDEIDLLFGPGNGQRDTRTLLNSGYKRSGKTARANGVIHTFAPVALAGLASNFCANRHLAPTRERAILLRMRKQETRTTDEYQQRLHEGLGWALRDALATWGQANAMDLGTAWPDMPEGVANRAKEIWEPLFCVAAVAGGDWPDRVSRACQALVLGDGSDADPEPSPRQRLLADLGAFDWGNGSAPTVRLLEWLFGLPGAPWRALWPNAGAAPRELAAMLSGVARPTKVWADGKSQQGYKRADFGTYLPDALPEETTSDQRPSGLPDDSLAQEGK